jgi:hypothetical protein
MSSIKKDVEESFCCSIGTGQRDQAGYGWGKVGEIGESRKVAGCIIVISRQHTVLRATRMFEKRQPSCKVR